MIIQRLASIFFITMGVIWSVMLGERLLGSAIGGWRSALRRARKGATLLVDPRTHFRVASALSRRQIRPLLDAAPLLMFKYLSDYLKTGLSLKERASILAHHYNVLGDRANEPFFRSIVDNGLELWRESVGDHAYGIVLTFPREMDTEGDLALVFRSGTTGLYTLSFTIGPGRIASLATTNVMYIARIQGKGGALDQIRKATKECLEISPTALLLAAAEGIALELDVERIIGIGAGTQLSVKNAHPGGLVTAYDEFWMTVGARKLGEEMYELTVPLAEKPLESIKRSHRPRVRRKRAFKGRVREQVQARFREAVLLGSQGPSREPRGGVGANARPSSAVQLETTALGAMDR